MARDLTMADAIARLDDRLITGMRDTNGLLQAMLELQQREAAERQLLLQQLQQGQPAGGQPPPAPPPPGGKKKKKDRDGQRALDRTISNLLPGPLGQLAGVFHRAKEGVTDLFKAMAYLGGQGGGTPATPPATAAVGGVAQAAAAVGQALAPPPAVPAGVPGGIIPALAAAGRTGTTVLATNPGQALPVTPPLRTGTTVLATGRPPTPPPAAPTAAGGLAGILSTVIGPLTAALSNPVTGLIAVGVAASVAAVALPRIVESFGQSVLDSNRHLAEFSGSMAAVFAQVELRDTLRNIEVGDRTSGSANIAAMSLGDLKDTNKEMTMLWQNMQNLGSAYLNTLTLIYVKLTGLDQIAAGLNAILEKMGLAGEANVEAAAEWFNRLARDLRDKRPGPDFFRWDNR